MREAHNIADLRAAARLRLPRAIFEFIDRGSEDEVQLGHNRAALDVIKLMPRVLRDVSERDQRVELFGRKLASPLIIAPTGIADLSCYRGESKIAAAAAAAGIPFSLATSSTTSMEEIGQIATAGFWVQMYMWERRDLSWQLADRAAAAGAEALILTVDTPVLPNREFNKRNGMSNPIRPSLNLVTDFAMHPRWAVSVLGRYFLSGGLPDFVNYPQEIGSKITGRISRQANSASVTWDDVKELRRRWKGRLLIKGIMHPEDARLAVKHGADGVIVSNHGGRNFDAGPAAINALSSIADVVGDKAVVLFDSGVRRGTDVIKALSLGAKAVLIGRPTLYGAAADGQAGASRALQIISTEIDYAMAMLGLRSLKSSETAHLLK